MIFNLPFNNMTLGTDKKKKMTGRSCSCGKLTARGAGVPVLPVRQSLRGTEGQTSVAGPLR